MRSIWGFLLCTGAASAAAALLLAVKKLLEDKLPPSWQYGIWWLLFARLVLPFGLDGAAGRQVLLPLPLWIETLKTLAEQHLHSAYDSAWVLTRVTVPVGLLPRTAPQSLTDWLFVGYLAGAALLLVRYGGQYLRLRLSLRRAQPLAPAQAQQLQQVCSRYGFAVPRAVQVSGLPTAFVCGVVRPVLALPNCPVDDKVLLHELMHLQHGDSAQSMLWCVLRAVHWCNPFLQYCFDRIGNDGEAACDQRVLERLQGEERRDYGRILLSMANEQYPRAAGTSSLSNGGENIARRIKAIARFKRYPQGMGLVSVCIAAMLVSPLVAGSPAAAPDLAGNGFLNLDRSSLRWQESARLAQTRTTGCTTAAGALDVYAKALWNNHSTGYLLAADPAAQQEYLTALRQGQQPLADGAPSQLRMLAQYHYSARHSADYSVWNLTEQPDGSHTAWLVWHWCGSVDAACGDTRTWLQANQLTPLADEARALLQEQALEDGTVDEEEQVQLDDLQLALRVVVLQPVQLRQQDGRWHVTATADATVTAALQQHEYDADNMILQALQPQAVYYGEGSEGSGWAALCTKTLVQTNTADQTNAFFPSYGNADELAAAANPGAVFRQAVQLGQVVYWQTTAFDPAEVERAGMYLYTHGLPVDAPTADDNSAAMHGNVAGGSNTGEEWFSTVYGGVFMTDDGAALAAKLEDAAGEQIPLSERFGAGGAAWQSSTAGREGHYTGVLAQMISPLTQLEPAGPLPVPYGFTVQIYRNGRMTDLLLLTKEG